MTATFLPGLSYDDYAALPGIRASRLRKMAKSPLHYRDEPDADTANRGVLRAIHQLVIEGPHTMTRDYVVYDGRRDTRSKEYNAFLAANPGRSILNPNEVTAVIRTSQSYLDHARAGEIIRAATSREETVTWAHPATGLACKARLDLRNGLDVYDLKTYGTTQPHQIRNRATSLFAHLQGAHYCEGAALALGVPVKDITYRLLVAEGHAPWDVAVCRMEEGGALRVGRELRERLLGTLAECEAAGTWPGACPDEQEMDVPEWADPEDVEFYDEEEAIS